MALSPPLSKTSKLNGLHNALRSLPKSRPPVMASTVDILTGPGGWTVDLSDCPEDWTNDAGVADGVITIGHTTAQSGALAAYGNIGVGMDAYFDYVNESGGIGPDGLQIDLLIEGRRVRRHPNPGTRR